MQIGYGYNQSAIDDDDVLQQTGLGKRRIAKNAPILCAAGEKTLPACEPCPVAADAPASCDIRPGDMLVGTTPKATDTCNGASGGGAYDQTSYDAKAPRVLGVVSTGTKVNCGAGGGTRYVRTDRHAALLRDVASQAAVQGGYALPAERKACLAGS